MSQYSFAVPPEATDLLPDSKLAEIQQAFAAMDRNQDGKIQLDEYLDCLLAQQKAKLMQRFAYLDRDQDGQIDFEEFLLASEPQYPLLKKFREFDGDQDGQLTTEEISQIVDTLEFPLTAEELEKLIDRADENGDRRLSYNELVGAIARFGFQ